MYACIFYSPFSDVPFLGPEYASASLFGFTPPPSDTTTACSSAPPTCTESMPATHFRPTAPNYTISFARPSPALISSPGAVYAGPASLPVAATTLRRVPTGQHTTTSPNTASHLFQPTQTAGVLFLPHSVLSSSCAEDAAAVGLYQTTVNGIPATDYGASYNIYQPIRSGPTDELMQQRVDGQRVGCLNLMVFPTSFISSPTDTYIRVYQHAVHLKEPNNCQVVSKTIK